MIDYLERSRRWGVEELLFTGGEPCMNKDKLAMLEATVGPEPASVLTSGTLLPDKTIRRWAR